MMKLYILLTYYLTPPTALLLLVLEYDPASHVVQELLLRFPTLNQATLHLAWGNKGIQFVTIFLLRYLINFCILYENARLVISLTIFATYATDSFLRVISLMKQVNKKSPNGTVGSLITSYRKIWVIYECGRNPLQVSILLGLVVILVFSVGSNVVVLVLRRYASSFVVGICGAFSVALMLTTKLLFDQMGRLTVECDELIGRLKEILNEKGCGVEDRLVLKKDVATLRSLAFTMGLWNYEFFKINVSNVTGILEFILDQTLAVVLENKSA